MHKREEQKREKEQLVKNSYEQELENRKRVMEQAKANQ